MNAYVSPTQQYTALRAAWLASHVRPCACDGTGPLDLREDHNAILCARCAREWTPRGTR